MTEVDAVVVGAGIAGLHQLHLLRERGLRVLGVEEAADVGGAWLSHDFPGAHLDVDAHLYQYFFSEVLYRDWSWSERFPGGYEVLRWLRFVADRLDLRRDIRFDTRVVEVAARPGGGWTVRTGTGDDVGARCVVRCTGSPVVRIDPPGLEAFAGPVLRTACWPRRDPDLRRARVGVVGGGVSAVQLVPALVTAHLTVFPTAPVDVLPRRNPVYGWPERERDKARFAELRALLPGTVDGTDDAPLSDLAAMTPPERHALLEELYDDGSLRLWRAVAAQAPEPAILAEVTEFVRGRMRGRLPDSRLAGALVPSGHPFGARPVALDAGWLEVFGREDVTLVDVPIAGLRPEGVELADGTVHALDVLVLAEETDPAAGAQHDPRPGLFTVVPPPPPANGAVDLQRQSERTVRAVVDLVRDAQANCTV